MNFFKKQKSIDEKIFDSNVPENIPDMDLDEKTKNKFRCDGVREAGRTGANNAALSSALKTVEAEIKQSDAANEGLQAKARMKLKTDKNNAEAEKNKEENAINTTQHRIDEAQNDINDLKAEIDDIKMHPDKVNIEEPSKLGLYIGGFILIFLTMYLFIFYTSASYSAFFKEIAEDDLGSIITNSIFDSSALSKAMNSGLTELILILTFTFVFLGLGFLIYQFNKQEGRMKYLKTAVLILITFFFDAILAYSIEKKIYDVESLLSIEERPAMTIGMAIQSANVWLILFSGFLVYIIWGFVFSFFMEEWAKQNKLQMAIDTRMKRIKEKKKEIKELLSHIESHKNNLEDIKAQIKNIDSQLSGSTYNVNRILGAAESFFVGWIGYMNQAGLDDAQITKATEIKRNFDNDVKHIYYSIKKQV